jgi:hypothetical protein
MAATIPTITTIQKEECIGNSLVTINANYNNIYNTFRELINIDLQLINNALNELVTFRNSLSSDQFAKAWVNFSGRLDPSQANNFANPKRFLWNQYNIDNVHRNGTGDYTITLATQVGDPTFPAYLTAIGTCSPRPDANNTVPPGENTGIVNYWYSSDIQDGKTVRITTKDLLGNSIDPSFVNVVIYQSLTPFS